MSKKDWGERRKPLLERNRMTECIVRLADHIIGIRVEYESTRAFCKDYLSEGRAECWITTDQVEIRRECAGSILDEGQEGKSARGYSDGYLETLAVYRKICEAMVEYDTILMHGSVVAVDGQAYLFTAKSGTGKSTHTRYWREVFGERAVMVNDDKPLLKIEEDRVLACGTPWDGKHRLSTNICVPLKAICILERGEENEIHPISPQEALPMVFQQTYRPKNVLKYMELIDKLSQRVSFYRLRCTPTKEAAQIAWEGMQIPKKEIKA